jgi:hypothetical protein
VVGGRSSQPVPMAWAPQGVGFSTSPWLRLVMVMAALLWTQLPLGGGARASGGQQAIEICCGWGDSLVNGSLEYSLKGPDQATVEVMRTAVRAWDIALGQLSLREVAPGREDVAITFVEGAGRTEGEAITSFTRGGFIRRVDITIKGARAPANAGGVEQITKHEFGHALGLGHANFDGDLMSAAVSPSPVPIPVCNLAAVLQANRWKLIEHERRPSRPTVRFQDCTS